VTHATVATDAARAEAEARPAVILLAPRGSSFARTEAALGAAGYEVRTVEDPAEAMRMLNQGAAGALVVEDQGHDGAESSALLQLAKRCAPATLRILCPRDGAAIACSDADIVIERSRLPDELGRALGRQGRRALDEHQAALKLARGMVRALAMRQVETVAHSQRLAAWSRRLADECQLTSSQVRDCELGAQLHDIGKVGVADRILLKPGRLDAEEWNELQRHPQLGAELLRDVPVLGRARDVVLYHHERWDGQGYPSGLRERQIPVSARVFAVCDAYEAITNDRPHRAAMQDGEARRRITESAGTQFDPDVVRAFLNIDASEWVALGRAAQRE
jgi:HD-GYP domain-containing protein (c-di-GMP phosphodiesterase class II)